MEQRSVVIVSAMRTPIGRFMGAFSEVPAVDLGVAAARAALDAAGLAPGEVDETVAGHGRQAGNGPNPARQVSVRASVPEPAPAYTVNKACGSSMKALTLAAGSIILGEIDVALVVGMENMSRTPYLLRGMRGGQRMGDAVIEDAMRSDGFMDPLASEVMGSTAENLAERHQVSREEQDRFALRSQQRAAAAWDAGRLADEVVPIDTFDARARTVTLAKLAWTLPEVDVVEVNEAFAAQVLACDRKLKFDWKRTNVNGGAIAIGHPIGMSGARIVGAVVHELERRGGRRGLATLCISGGQGMAVALERVE